MIDAPVKAKKGKSKKEEVEALSIEERAEVRSQLLSDVELFLNGGGEVTKIDNNVRADPPRKPSMSYGSTPI